MGSTQGTPAPNRGGAESARRLVARRPRAPLPPHIFTTVPVPRGGARLGRTSVFHLLHALGSGKIALGGPVGRGLANRTDDVETVQRALNAAAIPVRVDGLFGPRTEDAVKTAQRQLNRISDFDGAGPPLKVDGRINPRGPTQTAVRDLAKRSVAQTRMSSWDISLPWWRTPELGRVKDDTVSANRRTADHLRTVGTNGDIPVYAADAIRTNGDKAVGEFADLLRQIEKNDPARARSLEKEVRSRLGRDAEEHIPDTGNRRPVFRPEAPWANGGTYPGNARGSRKPPPARTNDAGKVAKGILGPAYRQVEALAKAFETLSPGADVRDMVDGSRETIEGVAKGDFVEAMAGGTKMVGGLAGMAVPGSFSGFKKAAKGAIDGVKKSADEANLPGISKTRDPITQKGFDNMPEEGFVNPHRIRTMQDNIKADFRDGRSIEQMVNEIKSGKLKPEDVEPVRVAVIDGNVFTIDHRRLVAHRLADAPIKFRKATRRELSAATGRKNKYTTKNRGMEIVIKER